MKPQFCEKCKCRILKDERLAYYKTKKICQSCWNRTRIKPNNIKSYWLRWIKLSQ